MALFSFDRCELCKEELFDEEFFCKACMEEIENHLMLERFEEEGYYVYSLFFYRGIIRDLIRSWKFYSSSYMIHPLSFLLEKFIIENNIYLEALSYIPMYRRKKLVRGFDPMEDLAKALAVKRGLEATNLLRRNRSTKPLYKMKAQERKKEIAGCFDVVARPGAGVVGILDDIYTTGATTREAARVLFEAGHQDFFFIVLAK